jgi:hypothetical protein
VRGWIISRTRRSPANKCPQISGKAPSRLIPGLECCRAHFAVVPRAVDRNRCRLINLHNCQSTEMMREFTRTDLRKRATSADHQPAAMRKGKSHASKISASVIVLWLFVGAGAAQQTNFTRPQYQQDFDYLWQNISDDYAYFDQKQTDWNKVREIYRPQIDLVESRIKLPNNGIEVNFPPRSCFMLMAARARTLCRPSILICY